MSKAKPSFIVAIDTQTLIWGVRRVGTKAELERAAWLFDLLTEEGAQVAVPTIVVAEFLTAADKKAHASIIDSINRRFLVKPFDIECASLAAELYKVGKPQRPQNVPLGRETLRADTMIIATAKVHKAKVFYSHDAACRTLANTVMDARDLPLNSHRLFAK